MPIRIQEILPATAQQWHEIWSACDYATFFHSWQWAEIWQSYTKGRMQPAPQLLCFSDGKRALLPLSVQRVLAGLDNKYFSSPMGGYGGWISTDDLTDDHERLACQHLLGRRNLLWRINPYQENVAPVLATRTDETHVIDLQGFEDVLNRWNEEHGSMGRKIRKARASEVVVAVSDERTRWEEYYSVYLASQKRWKEGPPRYEWKLFSDLFNRNLANVRLWLALVRDRVVAGALCLYAKRHAVYWLGAALSEYFPLRPVNLLMYEVIKDAFDRGFSWFDFNPSGPNAGVKAFKKSFGASPVSFPIVSSESVPVWLARELKERITRFESRYTR